MMSATVHSAEIKTGLRRSYPINIVLVKTMATAKNPAMTARLDVSQTKKAIAMDVKNAAYLQYPSSFHAAHASIGSIITAREENPFRVALRGCDTQPFSRSSQWSAGKKVDSKMAITRHTD